MSRLIQIIRLIYYYLFKGTYGELHKTSLIGRNVKVYNKKNFYMAEHTNINAGSIIMNGRARFIIKKWSGAAIGLTAITGNHISEPGLHHKAITNAIKDKLDVNKEMDKDIIVDEDVWIGANVTLLSGTHLHRCCIVGAGSVVRGSVPPYSIVYGNPAKVVGFRFTPKEMMVHEEKLFSEGERINFATLKENYDKYYLKRIKEIKEFVKL